MIRHFFRNPTDAGWQNCAKMRLLVTHCIEVETKKYRTVEGLFDSYVLNSIFEELCSSTNAQSYLQFLFKDVFETRID